MLACSYQYICAQVWNNSFKAVYPEQPKMLQIASSPFYLYIELKADMVEEQKAEYCRIMGRVQSQAGDCVYGTLEAKICCTQLRSRRTC